MTRTRRWIVVWTGVIAVLLGATYVIVERNGGADPDVSAWGFAH